jgi:PAS domain-containing protein
MNVSFALMAVAVFLASLISAGVLWGAALVTPSSGYTNLTQSRQRSVYLFKNGRIFDQKIAPQFDCHKALHGWDDFRSWFENRFENLPVEFAQLNLQQPQRFYASDHFDPGLLTIRATVSGFIATLEDEPKSVSSGQNGKPKPVHFEIAVLNALKDAPAIIFAVDASNALRWSNANFEAMTERQQRAFLTSAANRDDSSPFSVSIEDPANKNQRHYEITAVVQAGNTVFYAEDITKLVEADKVRNAFVQTLTKTFADLSTGLVVFDRDQRLILFNPAVIDLTDLSAEFLSGRPQMIEFFDRLRDNQVMPEPKDYGTWRKQIHDIIKSAARGHYAESWSLPNGQTYRLTGRPHPNGAVEFLIEDISDEMTLTRRARGELETHQAVLDLLPDAISVVGRDGNVVVCNRAFIDLVGFDPEISLSRTNLEDLVTACAAKFPGCDVWEDLLGVAKSGTLAKEITATVLDGGHKATCKAVPLPDNMFMLSVTFNKVSLPLSA